MINLVLIPLCSLLLGYLFGAFPTGYFAGRLWGVDVRKHGSGRTGGTNVLRTAGWSAFAVTVIGDLLKGLIPVLLARLLWPEIHVAHALAVLGVLIGHNWSVFIAMIAKPDPRAQFAAPPIGWIQKVMQKGRGGAGVAPTTGACLGLFPLAVLIIAPFVIALLIVVRYASVASLTAATVFPFVMLFFAAYGSAPWSYVLLAIVIAVIIYVVHAPNIQRLRAGTEKRFGQRLGKPKST